MDTQLNLTGFQPCDVRGEYGDGPTAQISPWHARFIGQALAGLVPPGARLLVAGDGRASTPGLLSALTAGYGRDCLNLGAAVPTPLACFAKRHYHLHSSAIVTASHNPPRFNGIKLQVGELPAQPELLKCLRDHLAQADAGANWIEEADMAPANTQARAAAWGAYKQLIKSAFRESNRLRLALDCMHGSADLSPLLPGNHLRLALDCMHGCYSGLAREALEELGYAVVSLRDHLAPDFHGITPDPAQDENLADLRRVAANGAFAYGAALDGDGDRVRFVDERGRLVDNGAMLVLLVRYLLARQQPGRAMVIYDQKTRLAVVHALEEAGAQPLREKSGHTFIRTRMLREQALFGGEVSGHFFWGGGELYPVPAGDCGLFTIAAVGDMLQRAGRPLSELARTVPESPCYTGDIRGLRYDGDREALLAKLAAAVDLARCQVSRADGLRLETSEAFVHLRASVTESDMLTAVLDAAHYPALAAMAEMLARLLPPDAHSVAERILNRVASLR